MSDHEHEHEIEFVADRGGYFVVFTTALIVVVMAIFTWVMWGMAKRVFVLTDVMVEMNDSFKSIVTNMDTMATEMQNMSGDVDQMNGSMTSMNTNIGEMNVHIAGMSTDITQMSSDINGMSEDMAYMSAGIYYIGSSVSRMTYDVGKASNAFTQPMSYMFGNILPF